MYIKYIMEAVSKPTQKRRREAKLQSVYSRCLITRKVVLPITTIGKNLKETIEENIKANFEGKCVVEGYIKPSSSVIVSYSSGIILRGNKISFEVVFESDICFPVEGQLIDCVAKNITKAGIRAESADDVPSPIIVFIAKDHHYSIPYFSEIKEGDKIKVQVLGQRFELNDKYISIIGTVKENKENKEKQGTKPKLVFED
jgi:DNA-directed RNA polymerase subunit E'/Rpb7